MQGLKNRGFVGGTGRFAVVLTMALLILGVGWFAYAIEAVPHAYIEKLVIEADRLRLHDDPYWLRLVHYNKSFSGIKSLVDDPKFFLSTEGRRNPRAELVATLRALFMPVDEEAKHVLCRFPARSAYLIEKLSIDPVRLPVQGCARIDAIMKEIRPRSVSLIFPTYHINSPASMFGHTLLSIETENKSKLLAHAVNYAAVTEESFSISFAIRGLLGLYQGYFSVLPYYAKVAEYSDFDFRDIWEYPLDLEENEVRRMVLHVMELENIYSDYYFLDENCSYNLLYLLEAGRPSLSLTDETPLWVLPVDTMRLLEKKGVMRSVEFRPSRVTKIKHIASLISADERQSAIAITRGVEDVSLLEERGLSPVSRARICDLSTEYLKFRYSRGDVEKEDYRRRLLAILGERSRLKGVREDYDFPPPPQPLAGHRADRLSIGLGSKGGDLFQDIRYRPVYHDMLDPDNGYIQGGQINLMNVVGRYYYEEKRFELNRLEIIDILSISPIDIFFRAFSWRISSGITRCDVFSGRDFLIGQIIGSLGGAVSPVKHIMVYSMADLAVQAGGKLENSHALGGGASAGLLASISGIWKLHCFLRDIWYVTGEKRNAISYGVAQSLRMGNRMSIFGELATGGRIKKEKIECMAGIQVYL